jgi:exonuclease VII small subunit
MSEQPTDAAPSSDTASLERLVTQLEHVAGRLRSGELDADEAARLVDDCAQLASNASAELERLARVAASEPLPGQDQLL